LLPQQLCRVILLGPVLGRAPLLLQLGRLLLNVANTLVELALVLGGALLLLPDALLLFRLRDDLVLLLRRRLLLRLLLCMRVGRRPIRFFPFAALCLRHGARANRKK
jgi:hypothetical protein